MIIFPKNRKEVADRASTDVQSELPQSQPFLRRSYLRALIVGYAGRIYEFYLQLKELLKQMFLDTATGDYLLRWGNYVDIDPNAATQASGGIVAIGTVGTVIPTDYTISVDGLEYLTQAAVTLDTQSVSVTLTRSGTTVTATAASDHNLASNQEITISGATQTDYNGTYTITTTSATTFTYQISTTPVTPATGTILASYDGAPVEVQSVDYGADTNQDSGTAMTWQTPISGLNNTAYVQYDGLTGGADEESDDDYRERVLFRYQNPHALFNSAEIETQAKKVTGVTRVWVEEITPVVGAVTIYFTRDNDDNIIPSSGEVDTVKDKILEITPANTDEDDVHVTSPTPVTVDFTFSALSPNNTSMQDAITANLEMLFREANDVGVNFPEDEYRCAIRQSIDEEGEPVASFTLSAPSGDITIADGEIAVLGTITFP
jgi:uncharacterized phage protein gp47/JayE